MEETIVDVSKVEKLIAGFSDVIAVYRAEDGVNLIEVFQAL